MGARRAAIGLTTETSIAKLAVRFFDVQDWTETPEGWSLASFVQRLPSDLLPLRKARRDVAGFLSFMLVTDGLRGLC